jgi:hypothetical protein
VKRQPFFLLLAACSILLCAFSVSPRPGLQSKPMMTMQVTSVVGSSGSGTFKMELILSKEAMALLKSVPNFNQSNLCSGTNLNLAGASEWTQTEADGGITCLSNKPFANLDGLRTITHQAFNNGSFNRLEIRGGHLYYDFSADMGATFQQDASLPFGIEAWWIVEVPGSVVSTNADVKDGRILKWNLLKMSGQSRVTVESTVDNGSSTTIAIVAFLLCGCCLVILLIGGGIAAYLILRNRKPSPAAPEQPGSSEPGVPTPQS